jgi:hypothetical protein
VDKFTPVAAATTSVNFLKALGSSFFASSFIKLYMSFIIFPVHL